MPMLSAMTVAAAVQPVHNATAPAHQALRDRPQPGPVAPQARAVPTEITPAQPVALPPVVTALTADLQAGRAAAEAARTAYHEQQRIAGAG